MVAHPHVYVSKSRLYYRHIYAYGVGENGIGLRYFDAAWMLIGPHCPNGD